MVPLKKKKDMWKATVAGITNPVCSRIGSRTGSAIYRIEAKISWSYKGQEDVRNHDRPRPEAEVA